MVFVVITKTPEAAERLLKNVAPERRLTWKPDTHLVDVPGDTAGTAAQRLLGEEEPDDALFFLPTDLAGWGRYRAPRVPDPDQRTRARRRGQDHLAGLGGRGPRAGHRRPRNDEARPRTKARRAASPVHRARGRRHRPRRDVGDPAAGPNGQSAAACRGPTPHHKQAGRRRSIAAQDATQPVERPEQQPAPD